MELQNTNQHVKKRTTERLIENLEDRAVNAKKNGDHVGTNESVLASAVLELVERIENNEVEIK